MPFVARTQQSKANGLQTFAFVCRLRDEDLKQAELVYLAKRDAYMQALANRAQFEEEVKQSRRAEPARAKEVGLRMYEIQSDLRGMRWSVMREGEKSYAIARTIVIKTAFSGVEPDRSDYNGRERLERMTTQLIGRPEHELAGGR